jgi:hypothetical protein
MTPVLLARNGREARDPMPLTVAALARSLTIIRRIPQGTNLTR